MSTYSINKGLEGVYLDETTMSSVNGEEGVLTIKGYNINSFANKASFEETIYLLLNNRFPTNPELDAFVEELKQYRNLSEVTKNLLKQAAKKELLPMDALRLGITSLMLDKLEDNYTIAKHLISKAPMMLATYLRYKSGHSSIDPRPPLNIVENFYYCLNGENANISQVRALETYLNTVCEHGLNASTFVARTIISTDSDLNSAISGAIGALKGPKHGGAPGPALDMVLEIGSLDKAETYIRAKLERGERIMGFGHRVYKVRDPRAEILLKAADELYQGQEREFFEFVRNTESIVTQLLEEYKPGRKLYTNVEFYTALLLHGCHFEAEVFSALFAIGRIAGWAAHCLEQLINNRLIRPKLRYVGKFDKSYDDPK